MVFELIEATNKVQLDRTNGDRSFWNAEHKFKTPSQGVATHVFAAFHPSLDSSGGSTFLFASCFVVVHFQSFRILLWMWRSRSFREY